jgi:signal transduction histidine kinase
MLDKCEEYLNIVLGNLKSITELAYIQETYQLLSELYAKRGNYKKAFEFKSLQLAYNDSIYNQQQVRNILETQTRFETEAKEREIQLLKKDNEIKQLEFEKQRNFQNILTFITILLAIAIAVTIYISRIIRKKNLLLAEKNRALEEANKKMAETEVNLRELNATKDKLFSIIAHDLKNPFNALLGFSDILERNYNFLSDEERIEYIGVINDSTQSLYKLLDNLLQWTRTQTGTITYIPENFKLLPLVKQEITNVNLNSEKKKISITVNIDENISVFADKNTTATIIRNLLSNAIKFTDLGGHIEIAARYKDQMVETSVSDSGIGINDNDLDRIFMLDGSFTTKGTSNESGTGLGLLLCKEFVEKNNGKIWVESEKGKGSTFFFTLPAK